MSEEKNEQQEKGNSIGFAITAGILIIMAAALIAYTAFKKTAPEYETVEYNGFVFEHYGGLWNTQWQFGKKLFNVRLHYNPYDVENVTVKGEIGENFSQQEIFITHDPALSGLGDVAIAAAEISLTLANAFDIVPVAACTRNETDACAARPIVTCSSTNHSVIYIRQSNETAIELNGMCATISGSGTELLRAAEKSIYIWYRII